MERFVGSGFNRASDTFDASTKSRIVWVLIILHEVNAKGRYSGATFVQNTGISVRIDAASFSIELHPNR